MANSADRANAESSALGGSKARQVASGACRGSSKPDQAHAGSVPNSEVANAPVSSEEQKPATVQGLGGGAESVDQSCDGTAAGLATTSDEFQGTSTNLMRQMAARVASGTGLAATMIQQPDEMGHTGLDGVAQADAGAATHPETGVMAAMAIEAPALPIELPVVGAAIVKADASQALGKAPPKNVGEVAGAKGLDLTITPDGGKAKAADSVGAVAGGSSHGAQGNSQNNGQAMQHSQPDAPQPAVIVQKVVDGNPAQAIPMHVATHEVATTGGTASGLQDAAHVSTTRGDAAAGALDGDERAATSGVNAARLIQTMGETEMRVGMQSAEFGSISIRTSVSQQQMTAQISLDHGDLSQAISGHISSLQTKLVNDYGLHTVIQVNHQGASASSDQGSGQREQRAFAPSAQGGSAPEMDVGLSQVVLAGACDGARLDIRA
jgi:hypothetical protein